MSARPNILWICTDSQRWDTLGCYGNRFVTTPQADRLAREGTLFEHAYVQNPLCQPSRGSFLTGRYPVTNRLRQNGQVCPPDLLTLPRILRDHGYVSSLIGKLHLNRCDERLACGPEWWKHQDQWWRGAERRIDDGYDEFHWDHSANPAHRSSEYGQWLRDRGGSDVRRPREDCPHVKHGIPSEHHQATWCAERTIDFVRAHADAPHPWLASVNIFDPHAQFDPPDDFLAPYLARLDEIPLPDRVAGEMDDKPSLQRRAIAGGTGKGGMNGDRLSDRDHRLIRAAYWAMCDHIDVQLGRILDALEASGQAEDTIVIFMSDHGEMLGDHWLYIKDQYLYDPAIRVPLIVRWPGKVAAGRRVSSLVELTDLAPALLEAAGLEPHPGMQGRSLWPQLDASAEPPRVHRDSVYCEFYGANPQLDPAYPKKYATMVRTDRHKLIQVHGTPEVEGELYDLEADPGEHHNRYFDPELATVKVDLLRLMTERMARCADPMPPRLGVY